jgi:hypothetical protein
VGNAFRVDLVGVGLGGEGIDAWDFVEEECGPGIGTSFEWKVMVRTDHANGEMSLSLPTLFGNNVHEPSSVHLGRSLGCDLSPELDLLSESAMRSLFFFPITH